MSLEARNLIYKFIAESDSDKIGGMSLVSIFLSEYRARNAEEAEELLLSLGEILEHDPGPRLAASVWLVEALAVNDVHSSVVGAKLRKRLASMESDSNLLAASEGDLLEALRKADLALYAAEKRSNSR